AVEEQFYLLWPLVMLVVLRRKPERLPRVAMWFFGLAVAIAVVVAVAFVPGAIMAEASVSEHGYWNMPFGILPLLDDQMVSVNEMLYLSTFTRAGGLLLGAAFAIMWRPVAVMR
ncbi:MAG TPA: hypothetical protein DCR14_08385, partial [Acidimicrobiaceae bacterium]|nr:hypothetical protein [Acidimicrobiaceae bacterium]